MKYILNQKGNKIIGYKKIEWNYIQLPNNDDTKNYEELKETITSLTPPTNLEYVDGYEIKAEDEIIGIYKKTENLDEAEMEDLLRDIINDRLTQIPTQKQLITIYNNGIIEGNKDDKKNVLY